MDFEECPPGYSNPINDVNCSLPCSYPTYGALCEGRCYCSKEDCHHVHGCHVTGNYLFFVFFFVFLNSEKKHYIYIKTSAACVYGTPIREVYSWFCLYYTIYSAKWYISYLQRTTFLWKKKLKKMWHALNLLVVLLWCFVI